MAVSYSELTVTDPLNQLVSLNTANESIDGATVSAADRRLFGLDAKSLAAQMTELGEPAWRGRQIAEAIYRERVAEFERVTTLPLALRNQLSEQGWSVGRPRIGQVFTSVDGTERYLIEIGAGAAGTTSQQTVETVWMPEGDDGEIGEETSDTDAADQQSRRWQRATICVSSQVGCAVNCQFCLTAKLGLKRNLTAGEIAGQVVAVLERHKVEVGRDRVNIVFMGMGEPFLNYENFMAAVRLLVEEVGLSPQRMTVSTSGIVPGIEQFALEPAALRPRLAMSLNAPNDTIRTELMPINSKWSIENVINAMRGITLRPRERVTFEYVLLSGVTDQPEHAAEVARLVRRTGLAAKVNLIAWNPGPGIPYQMPSPESVERFRQTLLRAGIAAYLRKPRGRDIFAACGQLKRTVEAPPPAVGQRPTAGNA